ncbi:receptor activity-modifying protein 3 isoform X3 [Melospiza georgiana]|uniref:receptor activity-modifying protein 3 isoform X3 n=1 Tax=Melospiza georgiana TaxID=44398 RepID=UPI0025AD2EB5|nr:receptor activity-modifying protein 3 isoform X3 [Melospiza georgiana]
MEAQDSRRRHLPVLLLWVNGLMTLGFAGARQQSELCNESLMLEKLPACGKSFEEMMKRVDSKKWCNLTEFIISCCCSGYRRISSECIYPSIYSGFLHWHFA